MPLVKIEMRAGKTADYKKAILDGVHQALVAAFKIPDYDRSQKIYELTPENMEIPANRTADYIVIEITAFQGRSIDAKRNLYKKVVDELSARVGISGDDIVIILQEAPLENWGVHGGKPASEVDIGFKVNV
jgi:phenylpyruvate tautomerase PptA (4-oxalocrotonate tautomerase family)